MRIGFDAKRAFNNSSGLGNYSRMLIEGMLHYHPEHSYSLYTPTMHPQWAAWAAPFQNQISIHQPERVGHKWLHPYWRSYKIAAEGQHAELDLYHGLSHEIPLGLAKRGIKSVVTMHDLIFIRHPELYPRIDRYFYRRKYERSCHSADHIVAMSQHTADDLVDLFKVSPDRISVVYQDCHPLFKTTVNELESSAYLASLQLSPGYILAVGTIEQRKNQLRLLEAYAQLPDDRPPLVIVGKKRQSAFVKQLHESIQKLGLTKSVLLIEEIPLQQLQYLYHHARFSVYISLYEGFGLPVLESLACGTPVLAGNTSCLEEAGGQAAGYVHPRDIEGIAMQMRQLLYNETYYQQLQSNCAPQARQFSIEKMTGELQQLYVAL